MINKALRLFRSLRFRYLRLISFLLFRDRSAIQNVFGSFISPVESHVANDLELHFALKPLMDRLASQEIDLMLTRAGSEKDGGYVLLDKDYKHAFLISGGISNDNNFEIALASLGAQVHQVDYSIVSPPLEHPRLSFSAKRIVGENSKKSKFDVTLDELVGQVPDSDVSELLLKLDIEGSEWEIFETSKSLNSFSQIFLELHYLDRLSNPKYAMSSIKALERLLDRFFPVFISGNNCCGFVNLGGFAVPRVLELTLLNREFYSPISKDKESINEKYQSQNYPGKAPLVMKTW